VVRGQGTGSCGARATRARSRQRRPQPDSWHPPPREFRERERGESCARSSTLTGPALACALQPSDTPTEAPSVADSPPGSPPQRGSAATCRCQLPRAAGPGSGRRRRGCALCSRQVGRRAAPPAPCPRLAVHCDRRCLKQHGRPPAPPQLPCKWQRLLIPSSGTPPRLLPLSTEYPCRAVCVLMLQHILCLSVEHALKERRACFGIPFAGRERDAAEGGRECPRGSGDEGQCGLWGRGPSEEDHLVSPREALLSPTSAAAAAAAITGAAAATTGAAAGTAVAGAGAGTGAGGAGAAGAGAAVGAGAASAGAAVRKVAGSGGCRQAGAGTAAAAATAEAPGGARLWCPGGCRRECRGCVCEREWGGSGSMAAERFLLGSATGSLNGVSVPVSWHERRETGEGEGEEGWRRRGGGRGASGESGGGREGGRSKRAWGPYPPWRRRRHWDRHWGRRRGRGWGRGRHGCGCVWFLPGYWCTQGPLSRLSHALDLAADKAAHRCRRQGRGCIGGAHHDSWHRAQPGWPGGPGRRGGPLGLKLQSTHRATKESTRAWRQRPGVTQGWGGQPGGEDVRGSWPKHQGVAWNGPGRSGVGGRSTEGSRRSLALGEAQRGAGARLAVGSGDTLARQPRARPRRHQNQGCTSTVVTVLYCRLAYLFGTVFMGPVRPVVHWGTAGRRCRVREVVLSRNTSV